MKEAIVSASLGLPIVAAVSCALKRLLLCSCFINYQTATFCCHKQGSMELQLDAGRRQGISHASCSAVQGSVEERIMEIIERRKKGRQQGSSALVGRDEEGRYQWARRRQRAQQDVAGSLKADRQNLRTAELELLFQVTACPPSA